MTAEQLHGGFLAFAVYGGAVRLVDWIAPPVTGWDYAGIPIFAFSMWLTGVGYRLIWGKSK